MIRIPLYLQAWPRAFLSLVFTPKTAVGRIPLRGPWTHPLVYGGLVGLLAGFIQFFSLFRYSIPFALTGLLLSVVGSAVAVVFLGFLLEVVLASVGREPGLYRSILFVATINLVSPIGVLLTRFHPALSLITYVFYLYMLFMYAQAAGGLKQRQAFIFIGVITLLTALLVVAIGFGVFSFVSMMMQ